MNKEVKQYELYSHLQGKTVLVIESPLGLFIEELKTNLEGLQRMNVHVETEIASFADSYEYSFDKIIQDKKIDIIVLHLGPGMTGDPHKKMVTEAIESGHKIIILESGGQVQRENAYEVFRDLGIPTIFKYSEVSSLTKKIVSAIAESLG